VLSHFLIKLLQNNLGQNNLKSVVTTPVHGLGLRPSGFDSTSKGSQLEGDED